MLTDADERMKWNGMSARLVSAASKTSQSAKNAAAVSAETESERARERENNLTFWLAALAHQTPTQT